LKRKSDIFNLQT